MVADKQEFTVRHTHTCTLTHTHTHTHTRAHTHTNKHTYIHKDLDSLQEKTEDGKRYHNKDTKYDTKNNTHDQGLHVYRCGVNCCRHCRNLNKNTQTIIIILLEMYSTYVYFYMKLYVILCECLIVYLCKGCFEFGYKIP